MKTIIEGHRYELQNFEKEFHDGQIIQFIQKEPCGNIGNKGTILKTISDGTTNEDVLEMLIDRMSFLQAKFPCRENAIVITKLEESLMWLNKRTQDRVKRDVEGKHKI